MIPVADPLGVVLAGGVGRRFGGAAGKAAATLGGITLLGRAVAALGAVGLEVVVSARADSALPDPGVPVWRESPSAPRHPLWGVAEALRRAGGARAVLVCAVDLPLAGEGALAAVLAGARARPGEIVIAAGQPLLGCYPPSRRAALAGAARAGAAVRTTVAALGAVEIAVPDPARTLVNVNTAADLRRVAELRPAAGDQPNVKS